MRESQFRLPQKYLSPDTSGASGHAEMADTRPILSTWYTDQTRYVDLMKVNLGTDGQPIGGIGFYKVDTARHKISSEPDYLGAVGLVSDNKISAFLNITDKDMKGHAWALAGHRSLRIQKRVLTELYRRMSKNPDAHLQLTRYKSLAFPNFIQRGTTIEVVGSMQNGIIILDHQCDEFVANSDIILPNGKPATRLSEAEFVTSPAPDPNMLLEDQLLEGAAQAVAAIVLSGGNLGNVVPMFAGTKEAHIYKKVRDEDEIYYCVSDAKTIKGLLVANVAIRRGSVDDELVANFQSLNARAVPAERVTS